MVYYEWILEFLDDSDPDDCDPDIFETSAFESYAAARQAADTWDTTSRYRIGLTRNVGNDVEGLIDRMWSYVDPATNHLSIEFNYGGVNMTDFPTGSPVPMRFQREINKYHKVMA